MRQTGTVLGGLCGAVLVLAVVGWGNSVDEAFAQQGGPGPTENQVITHVLPLNGERQQLVVIDPRVRTMAVYHISPTSGEIALKSVRNIHYDLQMVEFNSQNPLPQEIKTLLEQR